jgi:DNA-binding NtrC family response regulator
MPTDRAMGMPSPEGEGNDPEELVGRSPAMLRFEAQLAKVASSRGTVLFLGDVGTGKGLAAKVLHARSPLAGAPFVAVNCGALAEGVLDSELFGHIAGAFTGAAAGRAGLVQAAGVGTLFLDEIGETSIAFQIKLLRLVEDHEYKPVGSDLVLRAQCRIVAATNLDLAQAVREGRFRRDLLSRLSALTLRVPSLEEHREDIPILAEHFLSHYAKRDGHPLPVLTPEAIRILMRHPWPENVRDLRNVCERLVVLGESANVSGADLAPFLPAAPSSKTRSARPARLDRRLLSREEIAGALAQAGGNISHAAQILGYSRSHVHARIRELEMST